MSHFRWQKPTITFTSMGINQSWWQQQSVTNRMFIIFWGNYLYVLQYSYFWLIIRVWLGFVYFKSTIVRVDYIITPLKILQSLKDSVTPPDEKYSLVRRLSPQSAASYNFTNEEVCSALYIFIITHERYIKLEPGSNHNWKNTFCKIVLRSLICNLLNLEFTLI